MLERVSIIVGDGAYSRHLATPQARSCRPMSNVALVPPCDNASYTGFSLPLVRMWSSVIYLCAVPVFCGRYLDVEGRRNAASIANALICSPQSSGAALRSNGVRCDQKTNGSMTDSILLPFSILSLRDVLLVLRSTPWQEGDRVDCDFDRLDLSTNPYLEKNLEFLCNWIDDLSNEQIKFNQYTRNVQRQKQVCIHYILRV